MAIYYQLGTAKDRPEPSFGQFPSFAAAHGRATHLAQHGTGPLYVIHVQTRMEAQVNGKRG